MKFLNRNKEDLLLLILCAWIIPLTWILFLGWNGKYLIAGHDALSLGQPLLKDLLINRGLWEDFLIRPNLQGGMKIHDILGFLPLYRLCGALKFSSVEVSNLLTLIIQISFSYLSIRTAEDLAYFWEMPGKGRPGPTSLISKIGLIWLTGFTPALAWRICYGHEIILLGSFSFLVCFSLIVASQVKNVTFTHSLISLLILLHCFPCGGQQTILYSAVFGFPILLALGAPWIKNPRTNFLSLAFIFLIFLSAGFLSWDHLSGMLNHALSGDGGRALNGEPITYSYITATAWDWVSSIPWGKDIFWNATPPSVHHEINYAFGPLFLFLTFLPWKRSKILISSTIVSAFLALCFSMNVQLISRPLLSVFFFLKSFRVPQRSIYMAFYTILITSISALLFHFKNKNFLFSIRGFSIGLGFLILALGVGALSPLNREIICWLAIGIVILFNRQYSQRIPIHFCVLMLGLASLRAFEERILPFTPQEEVTTQLQKIQEHLIQTTPELQNPLVRVKLNFYLKPIFENAAYSLGLSSLDGYWFASARFGKLVRALDHLPYESTLMNFQFDENSPSFQVLSQLYNVKYSVGFHPETHQYTTSLLQKTLGGAWFSQEVDEVKSYPQLAEILLKKGTSLFQEIQRRVWIVSEDSIFKNLPLTSKNSICQESKVIGIDTSKSHQEFTIRVQNKGFCPLIIGLNYFSNLRSFRMKNGSKEQSIPVFPAYGALTGLIIPPGTQEILLEPTPIISRWAWLFRFSGWILAGIGFGLIPKLNHSAFSNEV